MTPTKKMVAAMTDDTRAADLDACEAPAEAMRGLLPERTDTDAFWDGDDGELRPGDDEDCDDLETRLAVAFAAAGEPLPVEGRPTLPEQTPFADLVSALYGDMIVPVEGIDDPEPTTEELAIMEGDGEIRALVSKATGEIVELIDAPTFASGQPLTKDAVDYYTGRRLRAMGRIEAATVAHAAEMAFWRKVIDDKYRPAIKRDEGLLKFLDGQYKGAFEALAKASLPKGKRSVNIGGLTASFATSWSGGGVDVTDTEKALDWLETYHPEAVKHTIAVSGVTAAVGKGYSFPEGSGLGWVPRSSSETFKVEAG